MENREIKTALEGKFNAASGVVVDFINPTVLMINPNDIVSALSKICRFNGQISHFYSVAQHSVLVEYLAPPALKRAALIHDCSEAYVQDIISPLKKILNDNGGLYHFIENGFNEVIFQYFNEPVENLELIKPYDLQAYDLEKQAFKNGYLEPWNHFWKTNLEYEVTIWNHAYAAKWFAKHLERRFPSLDLQLKNHY